MHHCTFCMDVPSAKGKTDVKCNLHFQQNNLILQTKTVEISNLNFSTNNFLASIAIF
jgi:hypothetical protein